jgi:hypothetical protein
MSFEEEAAYVASAVDRIEVASGKRPEGWISPEESESTRTPGIVAKCGLKYVADWCNDEQPYRMDGAGANFWAFPLSWELCDVNAMFLRQQLPDVYVHSIVDALETMCDEGSKGGGRVLGLHLHPWLSGQAFRAGALESLLRRLRSDRRLWLTTPGEVIGWCENAR